MDTTKTLRAAALIAAVSVTASACGSSTSTHAAGAGFDAASSKIVNPVTKTGGTITLTSSAKGGFDSLDPGDTYSAPTWNLFRTFGRTMLSYNHQPGAAGAELAGDLADGPGTVSDNGHVWTFHLRPGATFQDGTPITARDVKWAIERSNFSTALTNSPRYFVNVLTAATGPTAQYASWDVYKQGDLPDSMIDAHDPHTLVFHLPGTFGEFNYLMTLPSTTPVPYKVDLKNPSDYQNHVVASGAYKVAVFSPGKELKLVKNDAYNASSDPLGMHKANVDTIDVLLGLDAADRDQRLLTGQADMDIQSPLTVANHAQVLSDPALKAEVDDNEDGSLVYASLNKSVIPNLDCRLAIEKGIDKTAVLNELGGDPYGGRIATNILPSTIPGSTSFSMYNYDVTDAQHSLQACQKSDPGDFVNGRFHTVIAVQSNSPDMANTATAIQASLKPVGIDADIVVYPFAGFSSSFAGDTLFANHHDLGIILSIWGADWPSGYGFLDQIVTKDGIAPPGQGGGSNFAQYDSPTVDALFAQALATSDVTKQRPVWDQIDHAVMKDAVIVPLVNRKVLRYRSPRLGNVMINNAYGAYDLSVLGLK